MAFTNPAINPPRLASPSKRALHARTPSQSPTRSPNRHHARDFDPLLRDLSPTTTLRAFAVQSPDREPDFLSNSVATASNSERALGAKAAQACADLRSWARELEQWQWSGTFDVPEPVRRKQRMSAASLLSMQTRQEDGAQDEEFWGSLPAQMVRAYETRVDEINEDLDGIDVEELKEFVMAAHNQAGIGEASIDDSIGTIGAATDLGRLDDFTALITATILQALPYLSRLARLLHTWSVRLAILHAAPEYLRDLRQASTDLDHGWAALAVSPNPASAKFSRETLEDMKGVISGQVQSLGRRLDRFLDELEGREETIPDAWIDDFETLEGNYGDWVVRAERKVHENEWRQAQVGQPDSENDKSGESLLRTEGGLIGRTLSKMTVESRELPNDRDAVIRPQSALGDSRAIAGDAAAVGATEPAPATDVSRSRSGSPSKYSRHTPIAIDFDQAGVKLASSDNLTALPPHPSLATSQEETPAVETGPNSDPIPTVKKRAAFLNRNIEGSEQLNRSKPPPIVRPFEHASNAFTRLFKRDSAVHSSSIGTGSDTTESEKDRRIVRRRSFGRRKSRDRVVSNKENVRPESAKLSYGDLTALPPMRKSEDTARSSRRLSREGARSLAESANPGKKGYADLAVPPVRWSEESRRPRARTPKKLVPATYQPTTLASPPKAEHADGREDEFPENWPLSGDVTPQDALSPTDETQEDEISRAFGPVLMPRRVSEDATRRKTVQADDNDYDELRLHKTAPDTDALEEFFVNSLPNSPAPSRPSSLRSRNTLHRNRASKDSATTKSSIFSSEELARRSLEIERYQKQTEANLLGAIPIVEEESHTEAATPPRSPDEFTVTENAIFGSSPRSKEKGSRVSRVSRDLTSAELAKLQTPTGDSKIPEATLLQDVAVEKSEPEIMRRASVQSIESFPRSELKALEITPRSPTSPMNLASPLERLEAFPFGTPETGRSVEVIAGPSSPVSPLAYRGSLEFPSPPAVPNRTTSLNASPESLRRSSHRRKSSEAPSSPPSPAAFDLRAPSTTKTRSTRKYKDLSTPSAATTSSAAKGKTPSSLPGGGDNFDRHVSEVLDRVHAPIRFKSRPGAETPNPPASGKAMSYSRLQQPKLERQHTKSMTLAPASASPSKKTSSSNSGSEPEVKLYHLTQAGRTEPIKLFVRLVGEGERVMVRVGGGWADLADYLRQYAEHHGSRTVSEGMLELQTANAAAADPARGARRTFSTPAVPLPTSESRNANASATPSVKGTPTPVVLGRAVTAAAAPSAVVGGDGDVGDEARPAWLSDAQPRFTMGESDESDFANTPLTPTFPASASSRPGTANGGKLVSSSSRPQSRQAATLDSSPPTAGGTSFGMAGPSSASTSKRSAELPEQKARWVEGMLAQAKESAEKSEKFAEMGKVGGTRRVVFRPSEGGR